MESKQKELIAIGASVTATCVPCLNFHFAKAKEAGASDEEIAEAIQVGRAVRAGSAKIWDEKAAEIVPCGT